MARGPAKQFDPGEAVGQARDLFWRRGYDGTGIRALEEGLGIGRKSLYDTFGSKRGLYLRALEQYADTVIGRICDGLLTPRGSAFDNLRRVLDKLRRHHASEGSLGCLLGVAMGQAQPEGDEDVAAVVRAALQRLEDAFEAAVRAAQGEGDVRADLVPRDVARNLVALTQGLALLGRVGTPARGVVAAALAGLRPGV